MDDFTGSGTSFLRQNKDGKWTGKAVRFLKSIKDGRESLKSKGIDLPLTEDFSAHVHHYVSSQQAHDEIEARRAAAAAELGADWYTSLEVTEGMLLPPGTKLSPENDPAIWDLATRYYDTSLSDELREALDSAGQTDVKYGYADSALPLVLEHNCPNNALTILWAETAGGGGQPMRPLFPRRHRHA